MDFKGGIRWDKFVKTCGTLQSSDQIILNKLLSYGKHVRWVELIPEGLRMSYEAIYDCVAGVVCEDAALIERDVVRTDRIASTMKDRTKYKLANPGPSKRAPFLSRLLRAVSIVDDMGYCQGMNYVADIVLEATNNHEKESFCIMLYALRSRHLSCLYETKLPILSLYMDVFEYHLRNRKPVLADKLKSEGFLVPYYAIEWFTTCFTLYVPQPLTKCIFEMWLGGMDNVFIRVGIAIMELLEDQLMGLSLEELLQSFRQLVLTVKPEDVLKSAFFMELDGWEIKQMPTARSSAGGMAPTSCIVKEDSENLRASLLFRSSESIASAEESGRKSNHKTGHKLIQSKACIASEDVLLWLRNVYLLDAVLVREKRCEEWYKKTLRHKKYKDIQENMDRNNSFADSANDNGVDLDGDNALASETVKELGSESESEHESSPEFGRNSEHNNLFDTDSEEDDDLSLPVNSILRRMMEYNLVSTPAKHSVDVPEVEETEDEAYRQSSFYCYNHGKGIMDENGEMNLDPIIEDDENMRDTSVDSDFEKPKFALIPGQPIRRMLKALKKVSRKSSEHRIQKNEANKKAVIVPYIFPNMCDRVAFWDVSTADDEHCILAKQQFELNDDMTSTSFFMPETPGECSGMSPRNSSMIDSSVRLSDSCLPSKRLYSCGCDGCKVIAEFKCLMKKCSRLHLWSELSRKWLECVSNLSSTYDEIEDDTQRASEKSIAMNRLGIGASMNDSQVRRHNKGKWKQYLIANHLLYFGIRAGCNVRVLAFLLTVAGADPNNQDLCLYTPLHAAALYNRTDIIRLLLLSGGDNRIFGALCRQSQRCHMLLTPKLYATVLSAEWNRNIQNPSVVAIDTNTVAAASSLTGDCKSSIHEPNRKDCCNISGTDATTLPQRAVEAAADSINHPPPVDDTPPCSSLEGTDICEPNPMLRKNASSTEIVLSGSSCVVCNQLLSLDLPSPSKFDSLGPNTTLDTITDKWVLINGSSNYKCPYCGNVLCSSCAQMKHWCFPLRQLFSKPVVEKKSKWYSSSYYKAKHQHSSHNALSTHDSVKGESKKKDADHIHVKNDETPHSNPGSGKHGVVANPIKPVSNSESRADDSLNLLNEQFKMLSGTHNLVALAGAVHEGDVDIDGIRSSFRHPLMSEDNKVMPFTLRQSQDLLPELEYENVNASSDEEDTTAAHSRKSTKSNISADRDSSNKADILGTAVKPSQPDPVRKTPARKKRPSLWDRMFSSKKSNSAVDKDRANSPATGTHSSSHPGEVVHVSDGVDIDIPLLDYVPGDESSSVVSPSVDRDTGKISSFAVASPPGSMNGAQDIQYTAVQEQTNTRIDNLLPVLDPESPATSMHRMCVDSSGIASIALTPTQQYLFSLVLGSEGPIGLHLVNKPRYPIDMCHQVVTLLSRFVYSIEESEINYPAQLCFSSDINKLYCNVYLLHHLHLLLKISFDEAYNKNISDARKQLFEIIHFTAASAPTKNLLSLSQWCWYNHKILNVLVAVCTADDDSIGGLMVAGTGRKIEELVAKPAKEPDAQPGIEIECNTNQCVVEVLQDRLFVGKLSRTIVQKSILNHYYYSIIRLFIQNGIAGCGIRGGSMLHTSHASVHTATATDAEYISLDGVSSKRDQCSKYTSTNLGYLTSQYVAFTHSSSYNEVDSKMWYCGECCCVLPSGKERWRDFQGRHNNGQCSRCGVCYCGNHLPQKVALGDILLNSDTANGCGLQKDAEGCAKAAKESDLLHEKKKQLLCNALAVSISSIASILVNDVDRIVLQEDNCLRTVSASSDFNPSFQNVLEICHFVSRTVVYSDYPTSPVEMVPVSSKSTATGSPCHTNTSAQCGAKGVNMYTLGYSICNYMLSNGGLLEECSSLYFCPHCVLETKHIADDDPLDILQTLKRDFSQCSSTFWNAHLVLLSELDSMNMDRMRHIIPHGSGNEISNKETCTSRAYHPSFQRTIAHLQKNANAIDVPEDIESISFITEALAGHH